MAKKTPETLRELQGEHKPAPRGRYHNPKTEASEHSAVRNYVRDLVLGFNDGLVSVYAVVAGVAGAAAGLTTLGTREIAVAGLAAATAGALSMGLGEYLSTKSQAEYYAAEAERERDHIRKYPKLEREELLEMLSEKGYPPELVPQIADHIIANEDRFVDFMMREEFGVGQEAERSPWVAMGIVMLAFVIGAAIPLVPFFFPLAPLTALFWASGLAIAGLFAAGATKNATAGLAWWKGGIEMLAFGVVAALITYGVGRVVGVNV